MAIVLKSFKEELAFGRRNEDIILDTIRDYFKDDIKKQEGEYEKYDYKGKIKYYELKSRTNAKDTFPDTLITKHKIPTEGEEAIFIFKFTDGLYYIEYEKEKFKNYNIKMFQRRSRYDKYDPPKPHVYIPITDLTEIIKY